MKERKYIKSGYTTNFDKFVIPEWQREINEGTIGKICKSIQRHGFIGAILVTKSDKNKNKLAVYDGQHTFMACKRLKTPVLYNEFKSIERSASMDLSNCQRRWTLANHLQFGVSNGNEHYMFLDKVYKEQGIPLTALIMMYGGQYANISFKAGNWEALYKDRGNELLNIINDYAREYNIGHSKYARFIWGLSQCYDTGLYDHERMMRQLSKCSQFMTKQANPACYAQCIEDVYNYGVTSAAKVKFTQKSK